jgi:hypothetical protein
VRLRGKQWRCRQRVSLRVTSLWQNRQWAVSGREGRKNASGAKFQNRNQFATIGERAQMIEKANEGLPASQPVSPVFVPLRISSFVFVLLRLLPGSKAGEGRSLARWINPWRLVVRYRQRPVAVRCFISATDSSARHRNCPAVDRTRSVCRQATHRSSESQNRPSSRSTDAAGHSPD